MPRSTRSFVRAVSLLGLPLFSLGERPRVTARPSAARRDARRRGDTRARPWHAGGGSLQCRGGVADEGFFRILRGELARAQTMLASMPWHLGVRAPDDGNQHAAPRSICDAWHGQPDARGELLELPRRRPRGAAAARVPGRHQRVDGTVQSCASALCVWTCARSASRREFLFATRLSRVTRSLALPNPDKSLSRVVQGFTMGRSTRIGDALRAFNMHWARRVMRNGPVVLIVSDGWDRGDPQLLASELARVRRRCRRLIWLNPLLGSASYEPLTRGMQAALGHLDDFLPAHNMASLEDLARHLRSLREGHAS